jgi:hypothetical protein
MLEKSKAYFLEVIIGKVAPKVTGALISVGITFIIAHQEFMDQMGITYYPAFDGTWRGAAPTGQLLVVEFDTLGKWGAAMLVIGIASAWAFFQHHAVAAVKGEPQSGDTTLQTRRAEDPPKVI